MEAYAAVYILHTLLWSCPQLGGDLEIMVVNKSDLIDQKPLVPKVSILVGKYHMDIFDSDNSDNERNLIQVVWASV